MLGYKVGTIREAGLEARWTKTRKGTPCIVARKPEGKWYIVNLDMWTRAHEVGIMEAFEEHTCLGDIFSIKV